MRHLRRDFTPRHAGERGSAYVLALLVLVILTILGMTLALVTQTESQIGAAEQATTRASYAADSGTNIALARRLTEGDPVSKTIYLNSTTMLGQTVAYVVLLSPMVRVNAGPCNLCSVNQKPNDNPYQNIAYIFSSTSQRSIGASMGSASGQGISLAQEGTSQAARQITMMYQIQPMQDTIQAQRQTFESNNADQIALQRLVHQ